MVLLILNKVLEMNNRLQIEKKLLFSLMGWEHTAMLIHHFLSIGQARVTLLFLSIIKMMRLGSIIAIKLMVNYKASKIFFGSEEIRILTKESNKFLQLLKK